MNFIFLTLQFRLLFIFSHIQSVERVSHFLWFRALIPHHQVCLKKRLDSGTQRDAVTVQRYKQVHVEMGLKPRPLP